MKTKSPTSASRLQVKSDTSSSASRYVLGALAALATLPGVVSTSRAEDAAPAPPPPPSRVNALVNLEFSDKYLTPRGMIVQDQGLVFQPLFLGFANLYKDDTFSATAVAGFWNCFGTGKLAADGGGTTSWYEIDPIAGMSFGLGKDFTLDVTYTAFNMQIFNIPFSQHLETKLSFNDSAYLKAFALHPYIMFWKELDGKAVADTDPVPVSSFYVDIGIAPSYTFEKISLKLEAPCRVLLTDGNFYGTGAGPSSTVGLYEVGLKATIPMKFMPKGYGNWSCHLSGKYMDFVDDNLIATQGQSDVMQVSAGVSIFF